MPEDTQELPPVNPALTDAEVIDDDTELELDEESMEEEDIGEEAAQAHLNP